MRLIDADALGKRIVAEEDEIITDNDYAIGLHNGLALAHAMLINAPTIDAEPIVRCKDCKFYICDVACIRKAKQGGKHAVDRVSANFFCAAGRRRASVVLDMEVEK